MNLTTVRLELAAKMIGAEDGDDKVKAAVIDAMCQEDPELLNLLRGVGFCGIHYEFLDEAGDCPECLRTESIIAAEMAEARAMQQSQEILEDDDYFESSIVEESPPAAVPPYRYDLLPSGEE